MILKFCEGLLLQIRERQMLYAENVTSGSCHSYEQYKLNIGKLEGLKESEELVQAAFDAMFVTENLDLDDNKGVNRNGITGKSNQLY